MAPTPSLVVLASALLALASREDPSQAPDCTPLVTELEGLSASSAPREVEAAVARIVALPDAASLVLHALGGELPCPAPVEASDDEIEMPRSRAPGTHERTALVAAARDLGRHAFASLWERASEDAAAGLATLPTRGVIATVEAVGTSDDLALAARLASPSAENVTCDPVLAQGVEDAALAVLARDPRAAPVIRGLVPELEPELAGHLIRAVAHAQGADALPFLESLLGTRPALDLLLLSEIGGAARSGVPPFDEALCARVRAYLESTDRQLVRSAAAALAELQDEEALDALLELSRSQDGALAGAAFHALEGTTGLALPRRSERWLAWLTTERAWLDRAGERWSSLRPSDTAAVLTELRDIATHRLGRHRLAARVEPWLVHPEPAVRIQAARTLQALGSALSCKALEALREDGDAAVRKAAEAALAALEHTGRPGTDPPSPEGS